MDGHEPKVGDACPKHETRTIVTVEPVEKGRHFLLLPISGGSFKMIKLATDRTRDNLLRSFRIITPGANLFPSEERAAGFSETYVCSSKPAIHQEARSKKAKIHELILWRPRNKAGIEPVP
jgi:hypothetical protein